MTTANNKAEGIDVLERTSRRKNKKEGQDEPGPEQPSPNSHQ